MRRAGLLLAALLLTGCVSHPIGPARTSDDYERKARTTAEGAVSAVETVRLAAKAASKGNAFATYTATVVSEAEESASGLEGTFSSIQPPAGRDNAALRRDLEELLGDVVDHITAVRIAARRGHLDRLSDTAKPLADDSKKLNRFLEEHR